MLLQTALRLNENKFLPSMCTICIFCISLNEGLLAHFHELHCEIQGLKGERSYCSELLISTIPRVILLLVT